MGCLPVFFLLLAASLVAGEADTLPAPPAHLDAVMANPGLRKATGEQFTWNAAFRAHSFLDAFEVTRDPAWLEAARTYYDWCLAQGVSDDPDGFPGTIGADIGEDLARPDTTLIADSLVGDANLALPLVHFALLVRADPALAGRFGARTQEYVALAERMCWEKWNRRGCYRQDAHGYGSYRTHPFAIAREDRGKWVARPSHLISDNLNKHYKAGLVLLALHRLTGRADLRERVVALFGRAKAMFRLLPDEDRVVWNFWMPHGAYDCEGSSPKSWVGVHPSRPGYQVFEAGAFLAVYDAGLVFDRTDMERMVRTNRWMIEHGLASADGSSKAGGVWGGLARLDERIRAEHEAALKKDPIALAHLRTVVLKRSGYDRLDPLPGATASAIAVQPGRRLILAMPIPDLIETANRDRVRLLSRVAEAGTLTVELLGADGATVLGVLDRREVDPKAGAFSAPRWDGANPATGKADPGDYLLRWTLNGESRTWPVRVQAGTPRPTPPGPAPLAAGGRLACDFEQPLDARWTVEGGAGIAEGAAHGGKAALRLGRHQSASLAFGGEDDLPVRISFWAFDAGAKHGASNANGAAWGLRTGDGDLFVIHQAWRKYLKGDADVTWVHTGENQWFSPHPAGLGRAPGWNRWTFDFTRAGAPAIARDGTAIAAGRLTPARFVPAGGVSLAFRGSDEHDDGALLIDDIDIELPAKP